MATRCDKIAARSDHPRKSGTYTDLLAVHPKVIRSDSEIFLAMIYFTSNDGTNRCQNGSFSISKATSIDSDFFFLKKNRNAPRPSEHPPVRGENVKAFRWLQIQNIFMAFKWVPLW